MGKSKGGKMMTGGGSGGSNGGIAGSGIFGMIGTTIQCKSEDDSIYCTIMKLFNMLIIFIAFIIIMYVIYNFISSYTKKGRLR
jgi:hypothetical protein